MVIYEVNISVAPAAEGFETWLHGHVQDMLGLPGFQRADVFQVIPDFQAVPQENSSSQHWTVHYRLDSLQSFNRYIEQHADRMRGETTDRFGDQVNAERRVLQPRSAPESVLRPQALCIKDLDHLVLRVTDLDAMVEFYQDRLGCPMEKVQADIGLYQLRAGSSLIDLVTVDGKLGRAGGAPPGSEAHNLDHFCLRVDPFDGKAISRWLASRGVETSQPQSRYGADGQGPSIYIQDPEGNTVELKGPPALSSQPPGTSP